MIVNLDEVREMNPETQRFIQDMVDMFENNGLGDYKLNIIPKTTKSFRVIIDSGNNIYTEEFTAANCKGPSGTFKLASLINYIYMCNM
jgi:hypothetical protein